jgi:2,3-bisphosphoglycerate-dependent phosphoglycerate mutase
MSTLILLRHGESEWNAKNLFTGWVDVDLTPLGESEAAEGGRLIKDHGALPTVVHTSVLKRAIRTCHIALTECERLWIPVRRSWRLNERHYGGLQGLDKAATREKYGDEQLMQWRRSYDVPPPPIERGSQWDQAGDPRYRSQDIIPQGECLADVVSRLMPYWYDAIVPDLQRGETVLVAAHGNSLRGLVKHLDNISDADIAELNIPTGVPRVYELDEEQRVVKAEYLGNADEVAAKAAAVARQGQGHK